MGEKTSDNSEINLYTGLRKFANGIKKSKSGSRA